MFPDTLPVKMKGTEKNQILDLGLCKGHVLTSFVVIKRSAIEKASKKNPTKTRNSALNMQLLHFDFIGLGYNCENC